MQIKVNERGIFTFCVGKLGDYSGIKVTIVTKKMFNLQHWKTTDFSIYNVKNPLSFLILSNNKLLLKDK